MNDFYLICWKENKCKMIDFVFLGIVLLLVKGISFTQSLQNNSKWGITMKYLKEYNQKRNFKKTKEPLGKKEISKKKLRFCVQHHMARREHYDFRLEWKGVLISWAVPKGPSYSVKDKRLAVHVEDHPIDYRHFEGVIPKGEYGGGPVMVWDEGTWEPLGNFSKDFQNGSFKFILHGKRLKGAWTLVHFKEDHWLLIKENDGIFLYQTITEFQTSVKSGRTMDEILEGKSSKVVKNSKKNHLVEGIAITNPQKIIFKNPKVTKMDIVAYYKKVAKRMLPFVEGRILSTIRCPEGSNGECFFKKHFENNHSEGLGQVNLPSTNDKKEDYYYLRDITGIISEVQMNSYEFHVWGSKVGNLNKPDVLVFDLDPDEGMSLKKVREGVLDLKSVLDEVGLVSFLKTSGGKGYHVVVPTKRLRTWSKTREFAKNVAELMETKWPDKYTSNVRKEARKGKIFIDWIRNTKGATSVAPYSIRVRKGAYVSMPILWSELYKVRPNGILMEDAIQRLKRKDPWENFFEIDQ